MLRPTAFVALAGLAAAFALAAPAAAHVYLDTPLCSDSLCAGCVPLVDVPHDRIHVRTLCGNPTGVAVCFAPCPDP